MKKHLVLLLIVFASAVCNAYVFMSPRKLKVTYGSTEQEFTIAQSVWEGTALEVLNASMGDLTVTVTRSEYTHYWRVLLRLYSDAGTEDVSIYIDRTDATITETSSKTGTKVSVYASDVKTMNVLNGTDRKIFWDWEWRQPGTTVTTYPFNGMSEFIDEDSEWMIVQDLENGTTTRIKNTWEAGDALWQMRFYHDVVVGDGGLFLPQTMAVNYNGTQKSFTLSENDLLNKTGWIFTGTVGSGTLKIYRSGVTGVFWVDYYAPKDSGSGTETMEVIFPCFGYFSSLTRSAVNSMSKTLTVTMSNPLKVKINNQAKNNWTFNKIALPSGMTEKPVQYGPTVKVSGSIWVDNKSVAEEVVGSKEYSTVWIGEYTINNGGMFYPQTLDVEYDGTAAQFGIGTALWVSGETNLVDGTVAGGAFTVRHKGNIRMQYAASVGGATETMEIVMPDMGNNAERTAAATNSAGKVLTVRAYNPVMLTIENQGVSNIYLNAFQIADGITVMNVSKNMWIINGNKFDKWIQNKDSGIVKKVNPLSREVIYRDWGPEHDNFTAYLNVLRSGKYTNVYETAFLCGECVLNDGSVFYPQTLDVEYDGTAAQFGIGTALWVSGETNLVDGTVAGGAFTVRHKGNIRMQYAASVGGATETMEIVMPDMGNNAERTAAATNSAGKVLTVRAYNPVMLTIENQGVSNIIFQGHSLTNGITMFNAMYDPWIADISTNITEKEITSSSLFITNEILPVAVSKYITTDVGVQEPNDLVLMKRLGSLLYGECVLNDGSVFYPQTLDVEYDGTAAQFGIGTALWVSGETNLVDGTVAGGAFTVRHKGNIRMQYAASVGGATETMEIVMPDMGNNAERTAAATNSAGKVLTVRAYNPVMLTIENQCCNSELSFRGAKIGDSITQNAGYNASLFDYMLSTNHFRYAKTLYDYTLQGNTNVNQLLNVVVNTTENFNKLKTVNPINHLLYGENLLGDGSVFYPQTLDVEYDGTAAQFGIGTALWVSGETNLVDGTVAGGAFTVRHKGNIRMQYAASVGGATETMEIVMPDMGNNAERTAAATNSAGKVLTVRAYNTLKYRIYNNAGSGIFVCGRELQRGWNTMNAMQNMTLYLSQPVNLRGLVLTAQRRSARDDTGTMLPGTYTISGINYGDTSVDSYRTWLYNDLSGDGLSVLYGESGSLLYRDLEVIEDEFKLMTEWQFDQTAYGTPIAYINGENVCDQHSTTHKISYDVSINKGISYDKSSNSFYVEFTMSISLREGATGGSCVFKCWVEDDETITAQVSGDNSTIAKFRFSVNSVTGKKKLKAL